MTIEDFKKLSHSKKLAELKASGELLGPYEKNVEDNSTKIPGDIYAVHDFWVYLSEDEEIVIPTRKNPLPEL